MASCLRMRGEQIEANQKKNTRGDRGGLHCLGKMQEKALLVGGDKLVGHFSPESLTATFVPRMAALS